MNECVNCGLRANDDETLCPACIEEEQIEAMLAAEYEAGLWAEHKSKLEQTLICDRSHHAEAI